VSAYRIAMVGMASRGTPSRATRDFVRAASVGAGQSILALAFDLFS
jgi:hypothetical protein